MKELLFIVFLLFNGFSHAQKSVNTGGGNATGSGGSMSFSIGQVFYKYYSNTSGSMNQGVQQVYNQCQTVEGIDVISSCAPIVWIDGNSYSASNNTATHLIVGGAANGCDSLVTLNFNLWQCTQLRPVDCGSTGVSMSKILGAVDVNAPAYRFKISGPNNGGPGWNNNTFIYVAPTGQRTFRFQFIPGSVIGSTYSVEVATGDGFGNWGPYGNSCSVSLVSASSISTQISSTNCGTSVTMDQFVNADAVLGASGYRFRIQGPNNGGPGWTSNTYIYETVAPNRKFRFSPNIPGSLFGVSYSIDVAFQNANGSWSAYGNPCNVSISVPSTQIQGSQCNLINVLQSTSVLAVSVAGASGYRFRITGANTTGWLNNQFVLNRPNPLLQFGMFTGEVAGEQYQVEVAVMNANGVYGAYGPSCTLTLSGSPIMPINNNWYAMRDDLQVMFNVITSQNPFTHDFGIQVLNAKESESIIVAIYDMSGKLIERQVVNPIDIEMARFGRNLAVGMYMVEVRQGSNQTLTRQVKN
jgi:hypothetical protein